MNKPLILVVEDDAPVRNLITTTLKLHDYRFLTAANGDTALIEASSHIRISFCWILDFRILTASTSSGRSAPGA